MLMDRLKNTSVQILKSLLFWVFIIACMDSMRVKAGPCVRTAMLG